MFGVDTTSSHIDNRKNKILILGVTFGINGNFGALEKKFRINSTKVNTKFYLSLHYNGDNSDLFVNGQEICKFKVSNGNDNFPIWFCLGSIPDRFSASESRQVSLNGNVYDFSVDYNSIDKYEI